MQQYIEIDSVAAPPKSKVSGYVAVPGTNTQIPLIIVNGADDGHILLVTAGVHGAEYPSIEAALLLAAQLDPAQMRGAVLIVPVVSQSAFFERQTFILPEDGKNLNRQFPGKATGTLSERIAHTLTNKIAARASAWVDLHGGDLPEALVPLIGYLRSDDPVLSASVNSMVTAFGIQIVVSPAQLVGTTLHAAAELRIPALIAEAGQLGRRDPADTQRLLTGCTNVARRLGILPGDVAPVRVREFHDWPWVRSAHAGCWYPALQVGEKVREGQVIGTVTDIFGVRQADYHAPASGVVLLLWQSLAVQVGDPLAGVAVE
ncbi:MAG: succinylglutamate desuccinylase/aspartoacylase family protein [Anaerolineae bacterium]|nr:succinylglutamate desuccinylase/aspartoacylase family protein [Anaerolineae bacterium]